MSCQFREAVNDTFKCRITQSECIIKTDTATFNQDSCEIRQAFKDMK